MKSLRSTGEEEAPALTHIALQERLRGGAELLARRVRNDDEDEAIEGTDACIQRAGELCKKGDFTVIKVAKPQQDMRFDVPTVGVRTLRTMVAARARVLAIEGGRTILLDDDEFREFAAYHKLSVVALSGRPASEAAA